MWKTLGPLVVLAASGCGAASLVLKEPLVTRCSDAGLKGCPALAEGVVQYIDGDKAAATEKLKLAAGANAPDKLVQFATAAKAIASLPGASSYAKPISDALDILVVGAEAKSSAQTAVTDAAREAASANARSTPGAAPAEAAFDPKRSRTETVNPAMAKGATFCDSWKVETPQPGGYCSKIRSFIGPLVVTDVHSAGNCPDELFLVAGNPDTPAWSISTNTAFSIHGARYVVTDDQPLYVAARSTTAGAALKKSSACSVTWSGYKP